MIIFIEGSNFRYENSVQETTQIKVIRAVIRYYLQCTCDIALVHQGHTLLDDFDLQHYNIQNGSTLAVQFCLKTTSVHAEVVA
jgi:hypothetical protein